MTDTKATRMWALDGARLYMATADLMIGGIGVREVPIPTFLIEHGSDLVLVDTGMDPDAQGGREEEIYGDLKPLAILRYDKGTTVLDQLGAIGKKPSDVTHVVISHLHFDHTGGLPWFRGAKFYMGAKDYEQVKDVLEGRAEASIAVRPKDWAPVMNEDWHLLDDDLDLFGDGSVKILSLPGHTPGNMSVEVILPSRTITLTMDTTHLREAYVTETPMPLDHDHDDARNSMRRLKKRATESGAEVWIGHDPEDWKAWNAPGVYS